MADWLRACWDFDDLAGSQARFEQLLEAETDETARAEILTQLARVEGLRGDFDAGERLIEEAEALAARGVARARVDLERGRLRRSSGDREAARPLFESAYATACDSEEHFLAADAAHMVALVAPNADAFGAWTRRGLELAEANDDASYWLGPLLNNLGWELYEANDFAGALDAFDRALAAREREPEQPGQIEIARYAVGKTLRALGRADEAIPLLERAVAWGATQDAPDGWFHEELAEEYAAVGRTDDAAAQARLAILLLERDDPSFPERRARLEALAG